MDDMTIWAGPTVLRYWYDVEGIILSVLDGN